MTNIMFHQNIYQNWHFFYVDRSFFSSTAGRMSYLRREGKQALLLIHDFTASAEIWKNLIDYLDDCFDIISVDLFGHGNSESKILDPIDFDLKKLIGIQSHSILELLNFLGIKNYSVVGSSFGGLITMSLSLSSFKPDKVVLIDSAGMTPKDDEKFVDFKDIQIFGSATNYTCLLFLKNAESEEFCYLYPRSKDSFTIQEVLNKEIFQEYKLSMPSPDHQSWVLSDNKGSNLMKKLTDKSETLGDISKNIFQGLVTGADSIYFVKVISEMAETAKIMNLADNHEFVIEKSILKKLLKGKDVRKWSVEWKGYYVVYPYLVKNGKASLIPFSEIRDSYPLAYEYFKHYELYLKSRENNRLENDDNWHQFGRLQNIEKFELPKIITQVLASSNTFALDNEGIYYFVGGGNAGGYGIVLKEEYRDYYYYVLALLNSKVLEFYLKNISTPFRGGYFSYGKRFIEQLPILLTDNSTKDEIDRISKKQLKLSEILISKGDIETDTTDKIRKEIVRNGENLNETIYNLYNLTKSEIQTVEDFSKNE